MKKILFLLSTCFLGFFSAQTTRFVYQVSIKADSTNAKSIKTELANLDVTAKESVFYSDLRLKRDSIFSRARQTGSFNFDRSQMENLRSSLEFVVQKKYKDQSLIYKSRIGRDEYAYNETPKFNWKILPETVKIGDYKTQKAEMDYGGRKWNAWFTNDIPVQDGPYKFSGLPGLIVKIEDEKGNYSFDLMESKSIDAPADFIAHGNVIRLAKKDFIKQMEAYRKDPISSITAGNSRRFYMQKMDPAQRKEMEAQIKKRVSDFNNPIELK